jgi:hypothetical protein
MSRIWAKLLLGLALVSSCWEGEVRAEVEVGALREMLSHAVSYS